LATRTSEKATMPSGLPTNSPSAMPCATGALSSVASEEAESATAVLASAKMGITSSDVHGDSAWCSRSSSVSASASAPAASAGVGSAMAVTTPAMSALMPPRSRQYHSATPATAYSGRSASRARRDSATRPAQMATAAVR
jgi:hypothetical protein